MTTEITEIAEIIARDTNTLLDTILFPIPLDQAWIPSAAASGMIWSATGQWLNAELELDKQDVAPETVDDIEVKQAKLAGVIASMFPLLTKKMSVDFESMLTQMLTKPYVPAARDVEAEAIQASRLLGISLDEARAQLTTQMATPNPFRLERVKFSSLYATKLRHEVEVQGARDLTPSELLTFTEMLYRQLVGTDDETGPATPDTPKNKRNGKPSAILRAQKDYFTFSLPAIKQEKAAICNLLKDAAKQIGSVSSVILELAREEESQGRETDERDTLHADMK